MKRDSELYPYRRHLRTCEYFGLGGRDIRLDKCKCPFHVDGIHDGGRIRQSLKTRSRQLADRRLAELVRSLDQADEQDDTQAVAATYQQPHAPAKIRQAAGTVAEAVVRYLKSHGDVSEGGMYRGDLEFGTWRKYRNSLGLFSAFCEARHITALTQVTTDVIEDFRGTRDVKPITWRVELQALRTFFKYAVVHQWLVSNPAKDVQGPRITKLNDVVPYSKEEECRILAACDQIGPQHYGEKWAMYERLRSRGMVLTLRHTALRVVDVATLRKDAVSWDAAKSTWRVFLRTQKSGEAVFLPIPDTLKHALDAVPPPRGADSDCPYFFWNGKTSRRAVVGIAERSLSAVFRRSGVRNAGAHRYRHTLATWLLADQGATFEQVADILGNSAEIVRKHYAKWAKGRQDSIDGLMLAHFRAMGATNSVTKQSHEKTAPVN